MVDVDAIVLHCVERKKNRKQGLACHCKRFSVRARANFFSETMSILPAFHLLSPTKKTSFLPPQTQLQIIPKPQLFVVDSGTEVNYSEKYHPNVRTVYLHGVISDPEYSFSCRNEEYGRTTTLRIGFFFCRLYLSLVRFHGALSHPHLPPSTSWLFPLSFVLEDMALSPIVALRATSCVGFAPTSTNQPSTRPQTSAAP